MKASQLIIGKKYTVIDDDKHSFLKGQVVIFQYTYDGSLFWFKDDANKIQALRLDQIKEHKA